MKLLAEMGRVPSSRTQKTLLDAHTYFMIDPVKSIDQAQRWEKLWNDAFINK